MSFHFAAKAASEKEHFTYHSRSVRVRDKLQRDQSRAPGLIFYGFCMPDKIGLE
jgi:hypothetical protein